MSAKIIISSTLYSSSELVKTDQQPGGPHVNATVVYWGAGYRSQKDCPVRCGFASITTEAIASATLLGCRHPESSSSGATSFRRSVTVLAGATQYARIPEPLPSSASVSVRLWTPALLMEYAPCPTRPPSTELDLQNPPAGNKHRTQATNQQPS